MIFTFHNPTKILFGKGMISQIGSEISALGIKKVLLVAGSGSIKENTVYSQVCDSLKAAKIAWVELWGVRPNPTLEKVREGISLAKKEEVGAVLAVGGGSVIDSSKTIAAGVFMGDVWEAFEKKIGVEKALPIFTVLTISATASEMDGNAVVSDDVAKQKRAIASPLLYPKVSVIDPTVQSSLPKAQTAYGAIDGLTHVMEFYFVGAKEETTLAIGEALMRTIISSCDILMKNPKDEGARANMAWAITLALNGTSGAGLRGGDWSTHGIEYAISGIYPNVAHAAGLSVAYPAWILYVKGKNPETFARWAKEVWGKNSVEEAVDAMKSKFREWGAPITLAELGITKDGIPEMADEFMRLGRKGALKTLDRNDVISIFESVAE